MSLKDPKNQQMFSDFISEHAPLIHKHAKMLRNSGRVPSHIEDEDLHMAGIHGLVDALHKYDHDVASAHSEGTANPFTKYAEKRIRGMMTDHIVNQDPVGRSIRTKAKKAVSEAPKTPEATETPEKT